MTMAQSDNEGRDEGSSGMAGSLRSVASRNPATEKLLHSAEDYLGAQSEKLVGSLGEKVSGATRKLTDVASGNAEPGSLLGKTAKNVAEGDSPAKAALKGAVGGVTDKVKSVFKGKGKGPGGRKSMNIEESIDVGVPLRQAYNRWTQFTEFPKWSKGVQSVNQEDETKTGWNAKIFLVQAQLERQDQRADPGPADRLDLGRPEGHGGRRRHLPRVGAEPDPGAARAGVPPGRPVREDRQPLAGAGPPGPARPQALPPIRDDVQRGGRGLAW